MTIKELLKKIETILGKEKRKEFEEELKRPPKEIQHSEDMRRQKYLLPSKTVMKLAKKELIKRYMETTIEYRGTGFSLLRKRTMYFKYTKMVKGRIIKYQFCYWVHSKNQKKEFGTKGNQFEFILAYDFKKSQGLINEKYVFTYLGGYTYKPTYKSFVYPYKNSKRKNEGGFKSGKIEYEHETYKKIKINNFCSIGTEEMIPYEAQRILELNPEHVEMLYKLGYKNLWKIRIADKNLEFLKKNTKNIKKNITLNELSIMRRTIEKGYSIEDYAKILEIKERINENKYFRNLYIYAPLHAESVKEIKNERRLLNIEKEHGIEHLIKLRTCCTYLKIDFRKVLEKGLKHRNSIIEECEKENERIRTEKIEKQKKAFIKEEKEEKKTLEDVTKKFKELRKKGYILKPLRNMKDFIEISENMELCLMNNEFYKNVIREKTIIYSIFKETDNPELGEIALFDLNKNELLLGQMTGSSNRDTEYHKEMKSILKELKYKEIIIPDERRKA
jgi:hypothetical protein